MLCNKIVIIGAGLMGTSLYNSIKQYSVARQVTLLVKNEQQLRILNQSGITDTTINYHNVVNADLIVIATPIHSYEEILTRLVPIIGKNIITDIGSVKQPVEQLLKTKFSNIHFVASHPIAGSHKFGIGAVVKDLYGGKKVIITTDKTAPDTKFVASFWQAIGMHVSFMDAATHDKIYAHISHLVQKIAFNVKSLLEHRNIKLLTLADELNNQEFNKFIRLCASNQNLWLDIFKSNHHFITEAQHSFITELKFYSSLIQSNQFVKIYEIIQNGKIKIGIPFTSSYKKEMATKDFIYYIFGALIASSLIFTIKDKKHLNYAGAGFWDMVAIQNTITQQDIIKFTRIKYDLVILLRSFCNNFK